jgi:hypothetical protein
MGGKSTKAVAGGGSTVTTADHPAKNSEHMKSPYPALELGPWDWSELGTISDFWERPWVHAALDRFRSGTHDFGAMGYLDMDAFNLIWMHLSAFDIIRCFAINKSFLAALSDTELWRTIYNRENPGLQRPLGAFTLIDQREWYHRVRGASYLLQRFPAVWALPDAHKDGTEPRPASRRQGSEFDCARRHRLHVHTGVLGSNHDGRQGRRHRAVGRKCTAAGARVAKGECRQVGLGVRSCTCCVCGFWMGFCLTLCELSYSVYLDDDVVMSCARDRRLRVWSRAGFFSDAAPTFTYTAKSALTALECNGSLAYTTSLDAKVRAWRLTGDSDAPLELVRELDGHTASVFCVAFDDQWVLSGAKDCTGAFALASCGLVPGRPRCVWQCACGTRTRARRSAPSLITGAWFAPSPLTAGT